MLPRTAADDEDTGVVHDGSLKEAGAVEAGMLRLVPLIAVPKGIHWARGGAPWSAIEAERWCWARATAPWSPSETAGSFRELTMFAIVGDWY